MVRTYNCVILMSSEQPRLPLCQRAEGTMCQEGLSPGFISVLLQLEEGPTEDVGWEVTTASHCTVLREGWGAKRKLGESGSWMCFFDPSGKILVVCVTTDPGGRDHTWSA